MRLGLIVAGVLVLVLGLVVLLNFRQPVAMTEDQYQTTLALYRVCNQRDEAGLAIIEDQLRAADTVETDAADDPADEAIAAIIRQARDGDWERAVEDCRRIMEDQVSR